MGNPHFVLLDEPSSGMDPVARRRMWNVLSQVRASGKTLVLTSHRSDTRR
jgi:ATP-binding cassette subfamily A (ABC1) protein 3